MAFNYQLAKEIYGLQPWFVDFRSYPALMSILKNSRSGINLDIPEQKYNSPSAFFFELKNEELVTVNQFNWGDVPNDPNFRGIGLINIDGPITRSGGASSYGMAQLSSIMMKMHKDERFTSFLIMCDSGGGSSAGVNVMRDTINEIKKTKPVFALIPKGGMSCSAAYGIIAPCNKIYSEDKMNIVGSAGTMIQFEAYPANEKLPDGSKNIRLYATKSIKKNLAFEEAVNNDKYDLIINELLNPFNESFISNIQSDRPLLKGTNFDTGEDVFSKDAVGTYIDGLKSFDEVIKELISTSKKYGEDTKINKKDQNLKQEIMTVQELKQQFPETYNSIFNAGVSSEKDRVGTWMAHFETDPEKVKEGIKSGEAISGAVREELLVQATAKASLAKIEKDSPKKVTTVETVEVGADDGEKEAEEFYKGL